MSLIVYKLVRYVIVAVITNIDLALLNCQWCFGYSLAWNGLGKRLNPVLSRHVSFKNVYNSALPLAHSSPECVKAITGVGYLSFNQTNQRIR
jgi:hypothetical protein